MTVHRLPGRGGAESVGGLVPVTLLEQLADVLAERIAVQVAARVSSVLQAAGPATLVSGKEAAKLLDIAPSWLAAAARRGTVRSYKRGHYRRYDPREVVEDFKRLHDREN